MESSLMARPAAIIIGAGGHALSVAETVVSAGYALKAFVSDKSYGEELLGRPILRHLPSRHLDDAGVVVVAIGDNFSRERAWNHIATRVPLEQLPSIVHPSASVSQFARLSAGCLVMQRAVVASGATVGRACLLNTGSVLEHGSSLADFASLAPNAVTGGAVSIGPRTAISIGAVVRHGVTIGGDAVIGAASYVHRDVPSNVIAYGIPAKVVRHRESDDAYLTS